MQVSKRFYFDSAHYIEGHPTCGSIHGHTWTMDVTIGGQVGPNGMVIDFKELGALVNDHIIASFDHKLLNDIPLLVEVRPLTAETLAGWITEYLADILNQKYDNIHYICTKLQEGRGGWATYEYFV